MVIKKVFINYWLEFLVFGFIFTVLMIDLNPDFTFVCKAADSIGYAYSADYLYPSFHSSPPLYLLISHLFLQIPIGTDAWRMGLVSLLATMGACVFIYFTVRKLLQDKKHNKYYALLGVLVYGTSALVISQSIIIQTYAVTCMLSVGAYYFAISKRWNLMALMLGLGMVVHLLAFFMAFIMVCAFKDFRKRWKSWLIMCALLVFYIYIPLTNRPPYMWMPDPAMVNSNWPPILVNVYSFVTDTLSTIGFLIGKLSIYDFPKRVFDIIGIVGISIGVITIVPIVYYFWKTKYYNQVLFWLILTPIIIFAVELDFNTYDYTMLAIPFLSVVASIGLSKFIERFGKYALRFGYAVLAVIVGFGVFNCWYFDVGHRLDPEMSASKIYYEEFGKVPDGAIFMPTYCAYWEAMFKYNKDYGKHIYPITIDVLPSKGYQTQLMKDGVKLRPSENDNLSLRAMEIAQSIVELNDNVWTTVWTDPSTFGSKVVPANHDKSLVTIYDEQLIKDVAENPKWQFIPYNPWDVLTNSITVSDWNYVLMSNWNIAYISFLAILGYGVIYFIFVIIKRRKTKVEND